MAAFGRLERCEKCGWDVHPEVIQVDHKDGCAWNDTPENYQALCPNCHAWETYQRRKAKREAKGVEAPQAVPTQLELVQ